MRKLFAVCLLVPFCCFGEQWQKHFDIAGTPDVHVLTGNVPVEIHAGGGSGVEVELETRNVPIGESGLHIEPMQQGNRLELHVISPPNSNMGGFFSDRHERVRITVPRDAEVSVRGDNAPISVQDLRGRASIDIHNGPVEVRDFEGKLGVQANNAPISVRGRFTQLDLRMDNGPLELRAEPGSKLESNWHIQTENGPVSIKLPHDLRADVSFHTGHGPHSFDLPLEGQTGDRHDLHGKLNGGGPELSIHTQNGPLSIGLD